MSEGRNHLLSVSEEGPLTESFRLQAVFALHRIARPGKADKAVGQHAGTGSRGAMRQQTGSAA